MRIPLLPLAAVSILFVPAQAASTPYDAAEPTMGTFVGARFQVSLGGGRPARPRTSLAIAPTRSYLSRGVVVKTTIGQGVALDFGQRLELRLAGLPAKRVLGLHSSGESDPMNKQNLSTGGWVAVGLGVTAVAGGLYFLHLVDEAEENAG